MVEHSPKILASKEKANRKHDCHSWLFSEKQTLGTNTSYTVTQ